MITFQIPFFFRKQKYHFCGPDPWSSGRAFVGAYTIISNTKHSCREVQRRAPRFAAVEAAEERDRFHIFTITQFWNSRSTEVLLLCIGRTVVNRKKSFLGVSRRENWLFFQYLFGKVHRVTTHIPLYSALFGHVIRRSRIDAPATFVAHTGHRLHKLGTARGVFDRSTAGFVLVHGFPPRRAPHHPLHTWHSASGRWCRNGVRVSSS